MNNYYKLPLVLALLFSALLHLVVIFYSVKEKDNLISSMDGSVAISIELVAGRKSKNSIVGVKKEHAKNNIIEHKNIVALVTDSAEVILVADIADASFEYAEKKAVVNDDIDNSKSTVESSRDKTEEFLKLVYREINKYKNYPYQARRQYREGKVKINFMMDTNGHVSDIMVIKSSRFIVLDRAAQKAVEAISPFLIAANYLHVSTEFNVDIDYQLN